MRLPLIITCLAASPAWSCTDYDAAVAAVQGGHVTAATVLYQSVADDPACPDTMRDWMGQFLAKQAFAVTLTDAPDAEKRAALAIALGYETHWRSYAALGRLDWDARDYAAAALNLQLALNELATGNPEHAAEQDEIAEVYQLATAALALSDTVVELPRTRAGTPPALLTGKVRGFEIEEVPLPITFDYNATTFDDAGLVYANALVNHLLRTNPASVNLGGHTDPVGGEAFNLDLSAARAEALSRYIRAAGYTGEIITTAYGESQLPSPPPGITPGSEEHHRIARRVSFSAQ